MAHAISNRNRCLATAMLVIGITASSSAMAGNKNHNNRHVFSDYGKVLHVEPVYRTVTKRTPHRTCHVPPGHRSNHGHSNGRHNGHYRSDANRRDLRPRPEAVFIGGVIGGAIGHELTKSIHGRGSTGATLAGAAIGAGLVAGHQQQHNNNHYRDNRRRVVSHKPRHQQHNRHRQQRCTTTEHVQHVRELSGYQVTYRYRGRTFQTHTDHHPGDKIPVRVAISSH